MTDDQTPALEAGDEVVDDADQVESQVDDEGQDESQPAEDDAAKAEAEEKSKSAERRERRKAAQEALRTSEAEATAKAQAAQEQLERMRRAAQGLKKPTQADYPDYEDYQAALYTHASLTAMDGREQQRLEAEAQAALQQVKAVEQRKQVEDAQNWDAQIAEARTRYPDFEKVALSDSVPITPDMARFIVQSDVAAEIAYAMGKTPTIATAMHGLPPVEMARAIGRLEAQLAAPKPKTTSTAPEPINPVKGKASPSRDPEKMTIAEYAAWREKGGTF
jgi:chromosome segregation ATPase